MKCLAEDCNNEFESKTGRKKFCSNACKMKYFRKHGKKNEIKLFQMQVLYNQVVELINSFPKIDYSKLGIPKESQGQIQAISTTSQRKLQIIRSYDSWMSLRRECQTAEDWNNLKEQILAADNLTDKQKYSLTQKPVQSE